MLGTLPDGHPRSHPRLPGRLQAANPPSGNLAAASLPASSNSFLSFHLPAIVLYIRKYNNTCKMFHVEHYGTFREPRLSYCRAVGISGAGGVAMGAMVSVSDGICGSGPSSATASTWSMLSTKCNFIALRRFSGTSATSFL